jgi:hypothetical protein
MTEIIIALISSAATILSTFFVLKFKSKNRQKELLEIISNPNFHTIKLYIKNKPSKNDKSSASFNKNESKSNIDYSIDWAENLNLNEFDESKMNTLTKSIERLIYG